MTDRTEQTAGEVEAAIDEAIAEAGLDGTSYGRRVKQLLSNKLIGQFHEDDLMEVLEDMPPPYDEDSA